MFGLVEDEEYVAELTKFEIVLRRDMLYLCFSIRRTLKNHSFSLFSLAFGAYGLRNETSRGLDLDSKIN